MNPDDEPLARPAAGRRRTAADALAQFDEAFLPDDAPSPALPPAPLPFRERAFGGTTNPLENVDHLFRQTSRRLWAGVLALVLLVSAGVVWTAVAERSVIVRTQALMLPPDGYFLAGAGLTGRVTAVLVAPGDRVSNGQLLATIEIAGGTVEVTSPLDATVVAVDTRVGELATGAALVRLVRTADMASAVALFGASQISAIEPGQQVQLAINGFSGARFGSVVGRVETVGSVPLSSARLTQLTGDASLSAAIAEQGPLYEVTISCDPANTPSGVGWTRGDGPNTVIPLGALAVASVTVDRQSLLHQAFR